MYGILCARRLPNGKNKKQNKQSNAGHSLCLSERNTMSVLPFLLCLVVYLQLTLQHSLFLAPVSLACSASPDREKKCGCVPGFNNIDNYFCLRALFLFMFDY